MRRATDFDVASYRGIVPHLDVSPKIIGAILLVLTTTSMLLQKYDCGLSELRTLAALRLNMDTNSAATYSGIVPPLKYFQR